ncbi:MAG: ABC transporter ATP-binding protein [Chromatiaceae bacterium]|jgi:putative ABC transport system ATP-binding protein
MSILIRTEGLGKTYALGGQQLQVLSDVSIRIDRGEMVAIMGPSGSGKSTLLNLLGCLDRPTAGGYWLDGARLGELDQDRIAALRNSSIGFVFQSFHLLPRLTARQNVELPLGYAGWGARERRVRALDLLGRLGLADRADHLPRQLSGGQQQRVAIARALANRPALILADEPTGSLESRAGASIMDLFRNLNRSGVTLVIVTHDEAVARHARRIIQLFDGRLISDRSNTPVQRAVGPEQIEASAD